MFWRTWPPILDMDVLAFWHLDRPQHTLLIILLCVATVRMVTSWQAILPLLPFTFILVLVGSWKQACFVSTLFAGLALVVLEIDQIVQGGRKRRAFHSMALMACPWVVLAAQEDGSLVRNANYAAFSLGLILSLIMSTRSSTAGARLGGRVLVVCMWYITVMIFIWPIMWIFLSITGGIDGPIRPVFFIIEAPLMGLCITIIIIALFVPFWMLIGLSSYYRVRFARAFE